MDTEVWWQRFGDDYNGPTEPSFEQGISPPLDKLPSHARRLLEDQMSINRTLSSELRAKTQLLELADEARGRAKSESVEKVQVLQAALEQERQAVGVMTVALQRARAEVEELRVAERKQAAAVEAQRADFEKRHSALAHQLHGLRQSEVASAKLLASMRQTVLRQEAERRQEDERQPHNTSELLSRLAKLLHTDGTSPMGTPGATGGADDAVSAQLTLLVERCESRIAMAEAEAAEARDHAARAEFALQAAPSAEALRAQAEQARAARAALAEAERELKRMRQALRESVEAKGATDLGSEGGTERVSSGGSLMAQGGRCGGRRRSSENTTSKARGCSGRRSTGGFNRGSTCAAATGTQAGPVPAVSAVTAIAKAPAQAAPSAAAPAPMDVEAAPTAALTVGVESMAGAVKVAEATAVGGGEDHHIAGRVFGQIAAQESKEEVRVGGRPACAWTISTEPPPPSAAQLLIRNLAAELDVRSLPELAPRVRELTLTARSTHAYLSQLRAALELSPRATIGECVAATSKAFRRNHELEGVFHSLCGLLQERPEGCEGLVGPRR